MWYGVPARKRNDEPAGSGARAAVCGSPRAVLRPCVGFSKSRLKSCFQQLAGSFYDSLAFVAPLSFHLVWPSPPLAGGGDGGGCAGAVSLAQPQNRSLNTFLKLFLKLFLELERDFLKLYSRKTSCKV